MDFDQLPDDERLEGDLGRTVVDACRLGDGERPADDRQRGRAEVLDGALDLGVLIIAVVVVPLVDLDAVGDHLPGAVDRAAHLDVESDEQVVERRRALVVPDPGRVGDEDPHGPDAHRAVAALGDGAFEADLVAAVVLDLDVGCRQRALRVGVPADLDGEPDRECADRRVSVVVPDFGGRGEHEGEAVHRDRGVGQRCDGTGGLDVAEGERRRGGEDEQSQGRQEA